MATSLLRKGTRVVDRTWAAASLVHARFLNVHEYQGAELMSKFGVNVPAGIAASNVAEVKAAAEKLGPKGNGKVVLKSQVLAGGRGLGTFKSGLKGGVHIVDVKDAESYAQKMLGQVLVTKQTGEAGKPVNTLLVAEKMSFVNEMYFAVVLDRKSAGPMIIACSEGGTSIEDLAEKYPDRIVKVAVKAGAPLTDEQAERVVKGLDVTTDKKAAVQQIKNLYKMFNESDCTLLEVNPLAETSDGRLIAADAKLNFDDNAAYRHPDIFALRDFSQEDSREVEASKHDLNYIGLDGNIGCMVNGAGLAMASMDIIKLYGGSPANFLDVGGSASEGQIVQAFKLLSKDPKVKAILVNIFGGIMKCDVIAAGIVAGAKQVGLRMPLVVRLEGTNVEAGRKILSDSGLNIIPAVDLDDAAKKACAHLK